MTVNSALALIPPDEANPRYHDFSLGIFGPKGKPVLAVTVKAGSIQFIAFGLALDLWLQKEN